MDFFLNKKDEVCGRRPVEGISVVQYPQDVINFEMRGFFKKDETWFVDIWCDICLVSRDVSLCVRVWCPCSVSP